MASASCASGDSAPSDMPAVSKRASDRLDRLDFVERDRRVAPRFSCSRSRSVDSRPLVHQLRDTPGSRS